MELIATPLNPVPEGAIIVPVLAQDKLRLRVARWTSANALGTVVVFPGRTEFIEKYFETIEELRTRRLDVVAIDWRGQGLSERELKNPRKGHIDDFQIYERDLVSLVRQVLEPFCPRPWFALGHSMGASILLSHAREGANAFDRMILNAPMLSIYGLRFPRLCRAAAEAFDILGFGGSFIPGGNGRPITEHPYEGNIVTSDRLRYERYAALMSGAPELTIGDPTIGWVNAAFRFMRRFEDPDFARRLMTPTLIIAAGDDRIVGTAETEIFASRLKAGRHITIPYARHDILLERDTIRAQFWAAFDAFIPGTAKSRAA